MSHVTMTVGDQPLLCMLNSTLGAIASKDAFRVRSAAQDLSDDLQPMLENQLTLLLEAVAAARAALATTGAGMDHVDGSIGKVWGDILLNKDHTPWYGSFGMAERHARAMGLEVPSAPVE